MSIFLIILHTVVCIALILIVLLQTGKGADMGAAFGGGSSQTLFGSTGASTFLSKATTMAAIIFMITSLGLAYISGSRPQSSIMMNSKQAVEQPADPGQNAPVDAASEPGPSETQAPATPAD